MKFSALKYYPDHSLSSNLQAKSVGLTLLIEYRSTQRTRCTQSVLLFLVCFNNSAQFKIYGVTRSSSSCPFLCALGLGYSVSSHVVVPGLPRFDLPFAFTIIHGIGSLTKIKTGKAWEHSSCERRLVDVRWT